MFALNWPLHSRLWNLKRGVCEGILEGEHSVNSVAISYDGQILVTGSDDNSVRWVVSTNAYLLACWNTSHCACKSMGTWLTGKLRQHPNTHRVWDLEKMACTACSMLDHMGSVNSVAISPDGHTILSASDDKTIR